MARRGAQSDFESALGWVGENSTEGDLGPYILKARGFVRDNWQAVARVARELLEHKNLSGEEVEILIEVANGQASA